MHEANRHKPRRQAAHKIHPSAPGALCFCLAAAGCTQSLLRRSDKFHHSSFDSISWPGSPGRHVQPACIQDVAVATGSFFNHSLVRIRARLMLRVSAYRIKAACTDLHKHPLGSREQRRRQCTGPGITKHNIPHVALYSLAIMPCKNRKPASQLPI